MQDRLFVLLCPVMITAVYLRAKQRMRESERVGDVCMQVFFFFFLFVSCFTLAIDQ